MNNWFMLVIVALQMGATFAFASNNQYSLASLNFLYGVSNLILWNMGRGL